MLIKTLLVFIAVATDFSSAAQSNNSTAESYSTEAAKLDLVEQAVHPWNSVNRWLIEYDCTSIPGRTNSHIRKIMAAGAPGEYYLSKAHGTKIYPWQSDPYAEDFFIHDGIRCARWTFNRLYEEFALKPGDELERTIAFDILWRVIPSLPMTLYRLPSLDAIQESPVLDRALRSAHCHLLAGSETINGENCAVFDDHRSDAYKKSWIATRLGLCLMKEEIRYTHSNRLIQRILTGETGEVAPGLWMPTDYRVQWFLGSTNEDIPQSEARVRILHCLINADVPPSTFVPSYAAGSIKEESNKRFIQVSAGGEDLLLDIVGFMTKYAHLPTKPAVSIKTYMWPLTGLTCGVGLGLLVFPKKRQSAKQTVLANKVTE
jgi:hypothetical protein